MDGGRCNMMNDCILCAQRVYVKCVGKSGVSVCSWRGCHNVHESAVLLQAIYDSLMGVIYIYF